MAGNLGSLGSLFIDVAANTATFETDIGRAARLAERSARDMQKRMDVAAKVITASLVAVGAASVIAFKKLNSVVNDVANFKGLSEQIGDTAQAVASLKPVSDVSGVALEAVAGASVKLTAALAKQTEESAGASAAVRAIGLDFETFKRTSPVEQLEAVAARFAKFKDDASKTAVAVALFGRSGAELIPFLNDLNDIGQRKNTLDGAGIENADEYIKQLDRTRGQVSALGQSYAIKMLPSLQRVAELQQELLKPENIERAQKLADGLIRVAEFGAKGALATGEFIAKLAEGVAAQVTGIGGDAERLTKRIGTLRKELERFQQTQARTDPDGTRNKGLARTISERSAEIAALENQLRVVREYSKPLTPKAAAVDNRDTLADAAAKIEAAEKAAKAAEEARKRRESAAKDAAREADRARKEQLRDELAAEETARRELKASRDRAMQEYTAALEAQKRERQRIAEDLARNYGPASVGGAAGENARFAAELDAFEQSREEIIARGDDYYALMAEAARVHQDELTRIEQAGVDARAVILQSQLNVASTVFGGVADLASVFGAKAFKAYKAFAIAEAITSTISGAIGAFNQASKTLPPPAGQILGAAAAAGVTASGLAQVARIRSTNIGSRRYGGNVAAGGIYEVAEPGNPELLKYGSKTILAMGSQPGTVIPAKAMSAQAAVAGGREMPAQVNVFNNGEATVRTRTTRVNRQDVIDIFVDEIDDNAGPISRAMTRKTGMRGRGAIG